MDIKRFFMALPAVATMLLAASCSNQEIENIEAAQASQKHSIPFEAVVNSPVQTRGTLNDAGDTYVFQAGDKLFVLEDAASPTIMAELTLNPEDEGLSTGARFTGTLDYTGDEPTSTTPVVAWLKGANDLLLPATVAELADAGGEVTFPKAAIVASPADAVEKYSYFFSTTPATYSTPTFTLNQLSSFIDFNIALEDGTAAGDVGVSITNGGAEVRSGTVAAADDGFGGLVAHFTAAFMGSGWGYFAAATTLSSATVTLGTKSPISFGGTTELAPNKIYQVSKGYYEAGAKYTLTATVGSSSDDLPDQTLPINTTLATLLGSTYAAALNFLTGAEVTSGDNVTLGTVSKGATPITVNKSGTSTIKVTTSVPMYSEITVTITVTKQAPPVDLSGLSGHYEAQNGDVLTGLTTSCNVTIAAGATVTLDGVTISSSDYCIKCAGDATIILKDGTTNTLTSTSQFYPALWAGDAGTTLTIQGSTGVLNVESGDYCAGIGGGYSNTSRTCGNIRIEGGVITAQGGNAAAGIGSDDSANCGNITITGGTVVATGGTNAAGIGSGFFGSCGDITITSGVTSVTATKGSYSPNSIGAGNEGTCGTVTIGCTLDGSGNPVGGTVGAITTSPYTYPAP